MHYLTKKLAAALACAMMLAAPCVHAGPEDVGLRIAGATGARLAYFDDSEGKVKLGDWSREEVAAKNLQIQAAKGDFVQVSAEGKPVWLDRDRVRVARKNADCVAVTVAASGGPQVAGTRGASKQGGCL